MDIIIKDSKYWKNEINLTQEKLRDAILSETSNVKSTKSSEDTLILQNKEDEINSLKFYLSYCEKEYQKCLDSEGKEKSFKKILFVGREYGY